MTTIVEILDKLEKGGNFTLRTDGIWKYKTQSSEHWSMFGESKESFAERIWKDGVCK